MYDSISIFILLQFAYFVIVVLRMKEWAKAHVLPRLGIFARASGQSVPKLQLLTRQNDPLFENAVKHFFGEIDKDSFDQYLYYHIPIEDIYRRRKNKIKLLLDRWYPLSKYLATLVAQLVPVFIQHHSIERSLVATYIIKHIYYNGGFINERI